MPMQYADKIGCEYVRFDLLGPVGSDDTLLYNVENSLSYIQKLKTKD